MKELRIYHIVFCFILIVAVFGCGDNTTGGKSDSNRKNKSPIIIGGIMPLTGESAYWGENIKKGANLAIEEINNEGGVLGRKLEVIYEDSKGDPSSGTKALNKLITANNVECVIGDVISTVILATAPIANNEKVVILGFGESAAITDAGDYIFRNWNSAATDAKFTGNFAKENSDKIIVLYRNDAFGQSAKDLFIEEVSPQTKIIQKHAFDHGNNNFRPIITKFINKDYDGIYMASYHKEAIEFLRQYIEMGGKMIPVYGVSSWEESNLINFVSKNYPNKVYYGYPKPPDTTKSVVQSFRKNYKEKYGEKPEILCDNGYDAIYMLKYGIKKADAYDGEKIKKALYTLKNFQGASGKMSFDKNGDVNKPFGLKTISEDGTKWLNQHF